jgi:hypothetical protein
LLLDALHLQKEHLARGARQTIETGLSRLPGQLETGTINTNRLIGEKGHDQGWRRAALTLGDSSVIRSYDYVPPTNI